MSDIITVEGLDLWYGSTQALHHVSMDIPEKSITALIGPSGCGKSTFLKTLDRMNDLVPGVRIEGTVRYDGKDIFAADVDVNELRRQVGMVFQIRSLRAFTTMWPTGPAPTACGTGPSWTSSWSSPCGRRPSGTR